MQPDNYSYGNNMDDADAHGIEINEDQAIESVLGENPRATELQSMIEAVLSRKAAVLREAEQTDSGSVRFKLEAKAAELAMQLKVLRDEEAITSFVENSVRVTLSKPFANSHTGGIGIEVDDADYE